MAPLVICLVPERQGEFRMLPLPGVKVNVDDPETFESAVVLHMSLLPAVCAALSVRAHLI